MPPQNDEEWMELRRLVKQMQQGVRHYGEPSKDEVRLAKSQLRSRGWLEDGTLKGADFESINLRKTYLSRADFTSANLFRALLDYADLSGAFLSDVTLAEANLRGAILRYADLRYADLREVNLSESDLTGANLAGANLWNANLSGATLVDVNFSSTSLVKVDLTRTNLYGANVSGAVFGSTILIAANLSGAVGLEDSFHNAPSYVDYVTLYISNDIPSIFYQRCGLPELLRIYLPDLVAAEGKLYSTFISYSHDDKQFAQKLHDALIKAGARVWLDEKQIKIGQNIYGTVKHAIHDQDRVILICSKNSLKSSWVDREVNIALERELELKNEDGSSYVIMPISIDNYVFSDECNFEWTPELKRRLIGDFQKWKNPVEFQKSLDLLIRSLQLM